MAMPKDIQAACDKILTDLYPDLILRQESFKSAAKDKQEYFQGLETRPVPPKDGEKTAPMLTVKPVNQDTDWQAFGAPLPATMECSVRLDVYDGPRGAGWILRGFVEAAGLIYARAVNFGPEARDQDWSVLA